MKNKRKVFEQVKAHLLEQNARSEIDRTCMYRGDNGKTCAIGCLIWNKHYAAKLEMLGSSEPDVVAALSKSGVDMDEPKMLELLESLQYTHDAWTEDEWREELDVVERVYFPEEQAA